MTQLVTSALASANATAASAPTPPRTSAVVPIGVPVAPQTLAITLAQSAPPAVPFYDNVSLVAAVATLLGVGWTVWAAGRRSTRELDAAGKRSARELEAAEARSKAELEASERRQEKALEYAAKEAGIERDQSRDQGSLERQHSASEAQRERLAAIRREVYLSAIEELVKMQFFLGSLPRADLTGADLSEGLKGFLTAAGRVSAVAHLPTAMKVRDLSLSYQLTFMKSVGIVLPMMVIKGDIEINERHYSATQSEIQRLLAAMAQHNEARVNDPAAFAILQQSFNQQQAQASKYSENVVKARFAFGDAQMDYSASLMNDMKIIALDLDELLNLIRSELGLESDLRAFQDQTKRLQESMEASVAQFRAGVLALKASSLQ